MYVFFIGEKNETNMHLESMLKERDISNNNSQFRKRKESTHHLKSWPASRGIGVSSMLVTFCKLHAIMRSNIFFL